MLGEAELLGPLGGLGGALGGVGAAGLQARFGDQAFAEELLVPLEALPREAGLGVGLDAVALQFEGLRAGQAHQHLALGDAEAGRGL